MVLAELIHNAGLVDTEELYATAQEFMQQVMPHNLRKLKHYKDDIPLFNLIARFFYPYSNYERAFGRVHQALSNVMAEDDEFLAAGAGQHVAGAQCEDEPAGEGDQQLVAGQAAHRFVDPAEAEDVDDEDRALLLVRTYPRYDYGYGAGVGVEPMEGPGARPELVERVLPGSVLRPLGPEEMERYRAPFREAVLSISGEGAAAGEWKLSGVPAFRKYDAAGKMLFERHIEACDEVMECYLMTGSQDYHLRVLTDGIDTRSRLTMEQVSAMARMSGETETPCALSFSTSALSAQGSSTTPLPITLSLPPRTIPEGSSDSL